VNPSCDYHWTGALLNGEMLKHCSSNMQRICVSGERCSRGNEARPRLWLSQFCHLERACGSDYAESCRKCVPSLQ
jgi:hypothetical protein